MRCIDKKTENRQTVDLPNKIKIHKLQRCSLQMTIVCSLTRHRETTDANCVPYEQLRATRCLTTDANCVPYEQLRATRCFAK